MSITTIASLPGVEIAHHDDVYMVWQHGVFGMDAVHALSQQDARLRRLYPEGMYSLLIVEPGTDPPSSEVRAEVSRRMRESVARAMVVSMETEGFRGALVRAVMTGLKFAAGVRYPMEIVASVPEAARWLADQRKAPQSWARTLADDVAAYRAARRTQINGASR